MRKILFCVALLLAAPTSAAAQERPSLLERAVEIASGSAIVAHTADLTTTTYCLAAHTCVEANPILAPHVKSPAKFFAMKMGVALGSYAVKQFTRRRYPKQTLAFAIAENVAFFWIAKHNYDVHQLAKGR